MESKTIVFFPEATFGPSMNCVGIAQRLCERRHLYIAGQGHAAERPVPASHFAQGERSLTAFGQCQSGKRRTVLVGKDEAIGRGRGSAEPCSAQETAARRALLGQSVE